jgi:cytochrome oxidase Cu insertion factor (SCO1/SenC/PrrC family)
MRGTRTLGARMLVTAMLLAIAPAVQAQDFASLGLQPYQPPKAAPAFTLPDLQGKPTSLESVRGHVVLLFFWATW